MRGLLLALVIGALVLPTSGLSDPPPEPLVIGCCGFAGAQSVPIVTGKRVAKPKACVVVDGQRICPYPPVPGVKTLPRKAHPGRHPKRPHNVVVTPKQEACDDTILIAVPACIVRATRRAIPSRHKSRPEVFTRKVLVCTQGPT